MDNVFHHHFIMTLFKIEVPFWVCLQLIVGTAVLLVFIGDLEETLFDLKDLS